MPQNTPKQADALNLENKAQAAEQSGQYKEAIELYKTLLKQHPNAPHRQALSHCLLQRARELARKALLKEAVAAWENYAQNTQPPFADQDWYIASLLQLNHPKLKACLKQLTAQQLDQDFPELARLLGFVILAQRPELARELPQDSVFAGHLQTALQALDAYKNSAFDQAGSALILLPFRSAFKDFRTLMKANLALSESPGKALEILKIIPEESPYFQAARLLETCTLHGTALLDALSGSTNAQRQFIVAAKQFNKKQAELLETLSRQKNNLSDKLKFNFALHYSALWGDELSKAYCQSALLTYPEGQADFQKRFAASPEFERLRLLALQCEHDEDLYSGEYYWQQAINLLKNQGAQGAFKIALIMRHMASHQATAQKTVGWLKQSLDYDAHDLNCYIKIILYYDQQGQSAACQEWLAKAFSKFQDNVELLQLAIKAANHGQDFKLAIDSARQLLKLDPVNSFAKQTLFSCYLNQARWLIKAGQFQAVDAVLNQAQSLTVSKRTQTQAKLLQGFYVYAAQDQSLGSQLIAEAAQEHKPGLFNAHFLASLEAIQLDLPGKAYLSGLPPLPENYQLDSMELKRFIQIVDRFYAEDGDKKTPLQQGLARFYTLLEHGFKQSDADAETLLALCQCLEKADAFGLISACVNAVGSPLNKPLWTYYQIYSQLQGNPSNLTAINLYRLETSLEAARAEKTPLAQALIEKFLKRCEQHQKSAQLGFLSKADSENVNPEPLKALFTHLPNAVYDQVSNEMVKMTRKMTPEKSLTLLSARYLNNDPALLQAIKDNFEAYYAFMMLNAADKLKIDIGLTANDIIKLL